MGHHITSIILKGDYDIEKAVNYDLRGIQLSQELVMFPVNHYFSAYWQAKLRIEGVLRTSKFNYGLFPRERVMSRLVMEVSNLNEPIYAIIATDYFGGFGNECASVYKNEDLADEEINTINPALSYLGVIRESGKTEFETVGLDKIRSNPEYLEKYEDLADEMGV